MLEFQQTLSSEEFGLASGVPPDNIAPCVGLKIPRGDQDYVSDSYPVPAFHFASDPACAGVAVCAFY